VHSRSGTGGLQAALDKKGRPIGPPDRIIGANALHLGAVLVTNNAREFAGVPGLEVANWI
jgi:tRNA(fMet)-specific endonuclease VapC